MKKLLVFILFLVIGVNQLYAQNKLTIVTYNVWYDNPDKAELTWLDRKAGVIQTLEEIEPDIFCVQEALHHQVCDLEFSGYEHFGVGRDDGKKAGEYSAIFYDTLRFQLLDGGNFWLSETPEVPGSLGWDAACVRIATWVKLIDVQSRISFFVFNTHFDHVGDTARLESARLIKQKVKEIAKDSPVILSGDFNCLKNSGPYLKLIQSEPALKDARYIANELTTAPQYSFVGSDFEGENGDIIDHIFVSEGLTVLTYFIDENCWNYKCPSDHLPVVAEIIFR